ncbi:uncharacterized protein K02A2.6-like [Eupeodes corollae]|uniref:uncharacterized protein K02A2.6-like n=1 Tax=Eupeodes corollae TaxID=290404 RepID=UPI00249173D2|nr:uncharacterized protein K02A2.6-like [Eupeodes corollae]
MPSVEHTLGQLTGAKIFSKLDANSGFWQIKLTEESKLLTTFITPFGRFCYNRLPFGITSAPEHYQKRMSSIVRGLEGILCQMDDILVWGSSVNEHDKRLRLVLQRLQTSGVTLNDAKCQFGVQRIKFLGHILDEDGVHPDGDRITAIINMERPKNVHEVRIVIGLINYLGKFTPRLSDVWQPLNELLKKERTFTWGLTQERAFEEVKKILTSEPVLAIYDSNKETVISADSSSYGIGAVIRQRQLDGKLKPISYASRTLTECEKRYAQIEKEALALTWACERFQDFVIGIRFHLETDHKPLVPIFTTKNLDDLTPRLQRLRMRMMRYDFSIFYTPGKDLIAADALSRQPLHVKDSENKLEEEIFAHVNLVIAHIPASDLKIEEIWTEQQRDLTLSKIASYTLNGWPEKNKLPNILQPYFAVRDEIANENGLLMRGCRLIIPASMRQDILGRLHAGHQGITKCRARARESVWWPGLSTDIAEMINRCSVCIQETKGVREKLMPSDFPTRPWQKVAMDLFKCQGRWYLIISDFFSRFFEVALLERLTAGVVINHCKSIFARFGVPELVRSDNGTQFESVHTSEFSKFARDYGFHHVTSSPHFPQSNGFIEAAVKIAKLQLKKNADPYKALLEYRASPLSNGYSPAELLMGRRIRSTLPMVPKRYESKAVDYNDLKRKEDDRIEKQTLNFNNRHRAVQKHDLIPGELVWVRDKRVWATVREKTKHPRSYIIETPTGKLRRNSFHLTRAHRAGEIIDETENDIPDITTPMKLPSASSPEKTSSPITSTQFSTPSSSPSQSSVPSYASASSTQSPLSSPSIPSSSGPTSRSTDNQGYLTRYGRLVKPVDCYQY